MKNNKKLILKFLGISSALMLTTNFSVNAANLDQNKNNNNPPKTEKISIHINYHEFPTGSQFFSSSCQCPQCLHAFMLPTMNLCQYTQHYQNMQHSHPQPNYSSFPPYARETINNNLNNIRTNGDYTRQSIGVETIEKKDESTQTDENAQTEDAKTFEYPISKESKELNNEKRHNKLNHYNNQTKQVYNKNKMYNSKIISENHTEERKTDNNTNNNLSESKNTKNSALIENEFNISKNDETHLKDKGNEKEGIKNFEYPISEENSNESKEFNSGKIHTTVNKRLNNLGNDINFCNKSKICNSMPLPLLKNVYTKKIISENHTEERKTDNNTNNNLSKSKNTKTSVLIDKENENGTNKKRRTMVNRKLNDYTDQIQQIYDETNSMPLPKMSKIYIKKNISKNSAEERKTDNNTNNNLSKSKNTKTSVPKKNVFNMIKNNGAHSKDKSNKEEGIKTFKNSISEENSNESKEFNSGKIHTTVNKRLNDFDNDINFYNKSKVYTMPLPKNRIHIKETSPKNLSEEKKVDNNLSESKNTKTSVPKKNEFDMIKNNTIQLNGIEKNKNYNEILKYTKTTTIRIKKVLQPELKTNENIDKTSKTEVKKLQNNNELNNKNKTEIEKNSNKYFENKNNSKAEVQNSYKKNKSISTILNLFESKNKKNNYLNNKKNN